MQLHPAFTTSRLPTASLVLCTAAITRTLTALRELSKHLVIN